MSAEPDLPGRENRLSSTSVLIAGGGTAGHVIPGISIAQALVSRGFTSENIHFVGALRGIEARIVPEAGFEITLLPGRGIQRRISLQNVKSIAGIISAVFKAFGVIRRRRPAVVLGLGGFASAACSLAAVICRTPLIIAEQNARAGAVNRLFGRFAKACAVPFEGVDLPRTVVTGNPVRNQIIEAAENGDPATAREELSVPLGRTLILVFAGSLGSRRINEAIYGAVSQWRDRSDLAIYHVVGARDWDDRPQLDSGALHYTAVRYEDRMDVAFTAADLAVCRAGGTTVAELAVMGLPGILVPLPIATRDHQRFNAMELVGSGGAVCVSDDDFSADRLVAEVEGVLGRLAEMASAVGSTARPDAADRVAQLMIENLR
ncbi:MAG: undecaprenyldiphospho-muramoylpentapeptide beta-N-acetylglucosaminyltransferase [Microthrixaceae bacterium]